MYNENVVVFNSINIGVCEMTTLNTNFPVSTLDFEVLEIEKKQATIEDLVVYQKLYPNKRLELVGGRVIAMAGASLPHSEIVENISFNIRLHFVNKQSKCRAYKDIRVKTHKNYRLPDFVISCNGVPIIVPDREIYLENPIVVGEVLSECSTANTYRTEKLEEYKKVSSIQEIILISQEEKRIIIYHRESFIPFHWSCKEYIDSDVRIESIDCTIPIDKIYENLVFDV